jgi:uncharacterized protein
METDMPGRRSFLTGLMATGLAPMATWADAGAPTHLAACREIDGRFALCGLSSGGEIVFSLPLPGRGHAAAAHPARPEAVALARRPGTFALVLDCIHGRVLAELESPEGRHFYGHGAFSADGRLLFTPENDYEAARGRIGIWDAADGYRRIGEIGSGGTGPHDVMRLPGRDVLVVANGGIETHPDSGRAKLNLAVMRPNLSYVAYDGTVLETVEPPEAEHLNSIRHLAVRSDGLVAFAMQWQGPEDTAPPLLGLHRPGAASRSLAAPGPAHAILRGYAGSVAFSGDGTEVAITGPKGGAALVFHSDTGALARLVHSPDICGASAAGDGLLFTTGTGRALVGSETGPTVSSPVAWDNHLVKIG